MAFCKVPNHAQGFQGCLDWKYWRSGSQPCPHLKPAWVWSLGWVDLKASGHILWNHLHRSPLVFPRPACYDIESRTWGFPPHRWKYGGIPAARPWLKWYSMIEKVVSSPRIFEPNLQGQNLKGRWLATWRKGFCVFGNLHFWQPAVDKCPLQNDELCEQQHHDITYISSSIPPTLTNTPPMVTRRSSNTLNTNPWPGETIYAVWLALQRDLVPSNQKPGSWELGAPLRPTSRFEDVWPFSLWAGRMSVNITWQELVQLSAAKQGTQGKPLRTGSGLLNGAMVRWSKCKQLDKKMH